MNKKVSIPIVPILIGIIVLVIVIVMLVNLTREQGSKLTNVYNKMLENQTYAFTRYDFEEKHKLITYRKVDKTLIDMYNPGQHLSTLVMGGDTYLLFHENEEYYVYPNSNLDEEILTDNLEKIIKLEYETGKEKIYGKNYKYEEYNGVSDFLIISANDMIPNTVKTRFYFKGDELVYLKTIYEITDEETGERKQVEELQTIKVEYEVEDNVFEIPANYAEA